MKSDNFLRRTLDEVKRDFEQAQNPECDLEEIQRGIDARNAFWEKWYEETHLEEKGLEQFEEKQQYAERGQYQNPE